MQQFIHKKNHLQQRLGILVEVDQAVDTTVTNICLWYVEIGKLWANRQRLHIWHMESNNKKKISPGKSKSDIHVTDIPTKGY